MTENYKIQKMFTGFVFEEMTAEKKRTDEIWQYFLAGILQKDGSVREDSPNFGSELLMHAVIASLAKAHDASGLPNKIITLSGMAFEGLHAALTPTSNSKQQQSRISPLAMLDKLPRVYEGNDITITMQIQGDFELHEDGMGAIKKLLETKVVKRQCSHLHAPTSACLREFKCPEGESAESFIRQASLLALPEAFRKSASIRKKTEYKLHKLRFDMVAVVESLFPFARYGDCITFIVGGPWISNHFFPVVIVKTTDGLAGAVLDSYTSEYEIRLKKDSYLGKEHTDILGLLQAFLAINDHILFPEYSVADRRTLIEGLEFHFPEVYTQPSKSNACWLYSIAVIEQLYLRSSDLIKIHDKTSAHNFFDNVASAVSSIFLDFSRFEVWVRDLKRSHWDAQISEENVTVAMDGAVRYHEVGGFDISLHQRAKWGVSIPDHGESLLPSGYGESLQIFPSTFKDHAGNGKKKLYAASSSANRKSLAMTQENNHESWKSNLEQSRETVILSTASLETGLGKNAQGDLRCLGKMTQRILTFEKVLQPFELNKVVSTFLDNPAESALVGQGCVFMKCEQNWPDYNKGQGGADLVLSVPIKYDGPKQVVIFHAAGARYFVAGKSDATKSSVNGAQSKDFLFCAVPDNRFVLYYDSIVPTFAWPKGLQLPLASEHLSRPSIGGQSNILGETVAVRVTNWKKCQSSKGTHDQANRNESKGSVDLLTTLSKQAKHDKSRRKKLDFKRILDTLTLCVVGPTASDLRGQTSEVNILEVPGNGCCFPHSCSLSVMLSANPEHGVRFYDALFPRPLRFTSLHRYVFNDSLTGCARFWFARWCCQQHDVREILDQSVKLGVCSHSQEGAGLSQDMRISDFLNLIARSSDQVENGISHYFYTTLLHLFRAFLSEVLKISISILVLTPDDDNILFLAKDAVANPDDLKSSHFLVLSRSGGQNTAVSHYTPMLLDFKVQNIWGSCGLLPYKDLPRFIRELLSCPSDSIQKILRKISNFNEPNEHALPLFSETRLSRDLFLWRVTLISNLDSTAFQLGRTVICAPLYSIGLLGPYPSCASARQCMQMFQGHMKPAHNKICATVLRAMENIVSSLLICLQCYAIPQENRLAILFGSEMGPVRKYYRTDKKFREHLGQALRQVQNCQTLKDLHGFVKQAKSITGEEELVNWFCSQCQESLSVGRSFAGIPSDLYWGLYSSILNCPIVVLNDMISTWDSHKSRNDSDVLGKHFSASVLLEKKDPFECALDSLCQRAQAILPKYFYGLRDMETKMHSIAVGSDALSSIINETIGCLAGDPCGGKDVNGTWKLDTYARNPPGIMEIILSKSHVSTAGFMPVMTEIQMKLPHHRDKCYIHQIPHSFSELQIQVSTCKLALSDEKFWTEEAFRDFIFSIGRTGHVEQFPSNQLGPISKQEWAIFNYHTKQLALHTTNCLQNEIDTWLNLGFDQDVSQVNFQSPEVLRAQVLKRWFMEE